MHIATICEHIVSNNVLPGGSITIRIDKSADRRVIVSALEIVESGFLVVDVPTVAQGVDVCQGARSGNDLAIGVVVVAGHHRAAGVYDAHDIALEIGDIVVHCAVVLHGIGRTIGIVEEVNGIGSPGHAHQLAAGVVVVVGSAVHGLAGSQSAGIIGEAQAVGPIGGGGQISTVDPGKVPAGAVVVAGGVANGIIGDGFSVIGGQNIVYGVIGRQGSGCRWNKYTIDLRCWQYLIIPLDFEKKPWNPRIPGLVS